MICRNCGFIGGKKIDLPGILIVATMVPLLASIIGSGLVLVAHYWGFL